MFRIVDVLPVYLFWLWSLLHTHPACLSFFNTESLSNLILAEFLKSLKDGVLFFLSATSKYQFLSNTLVIFFKGELLLAIFAKLYIFGVNFCLQFLQTRPILLGGLSVDALLDLFHQASHVFFHLVEIRIFRKEGDLMGIVGLAEGSSQKLDESRTHASLFWDICDKYGIIRE